MDRPPPAIPHRHLVDAPVWVEFDGSGSPEAGNVAWSIRVDRSRADQSYGHFEAVPFHRLNRRIQNLVFGFMG